MDPDQTPFFNDCKGAKKKNFHSFFLKLTRRHIIFRLKNLIFCKNFALIFYLASLILVCSTPLLRKGNDPDPYLWLMDRDPDPQQLIKPRTHLDFELWFTLVIPKSVFCFVCRWQSWRTSWWATTRSCTLPRISTRPFSTSSRLGVVAPPPPPTWSSSPPVLIHKFLNIRIGLFFYSEINEWFKEDQAFSSFCTVYDLAPPQPLPPLLSVSSTGDTQEDMERDNLLTGGGGEGWGFGEGAKSCCFSH